MSRRHSKYKTLSLSNICGFWLVSLCGRLILLQTHRRRFFYFFRMMKKTNTRREGTLKTWEKNISKVTRKKRRGTPKTDTKKTTDDLLERVALVRSIDRLLPPPSTEYTAIDKSPNLGIFFFLTRPCENARGVRVERATVVLWCLFSK